MKNLLNCQYKLFCQYLLNILKEKKSTVHYYMLVAFIWIWIEKQNNKTNFNFTRYFKDKYCYICLIIKYIV